MLYFYLKIPEFKLEYAIVKGLYMFDVSLVDIKGMTGDSSTVESQKVKYLLKSRKIADFALFNDDRGRHLRPRHSEYYQFSGTLRV